MSQPSEGGRRGSRRRLLWRVGLIALAVLGGVGVVAATLPLTAGSLGMVPPDAAVDAALAQYRQVSGVQDLQVEVASGWSDCAIVDLRSATSGAGTVVAMVKDDNGRWRIARQSDDQVYFDTDDISDHESCLQVVHGTGAFASGAQ